MDEATLEPTAGYARLERDLGAIAAGSRRMRVRRAAARARAEALARRSDWSGRLTVDPAVR